MIPVAFILLTSSLAIIGGVLALVFLFITRSEERDFVDRTDRTRWWHEARRRGRAWKEANTRN
jgi:uncharacterized membrane protein